MHMRIVGWLGALALFAPRVATAAPAAPCVAPQLFPSAAVVPADLPAFGYTSTTATASDVQLVAVFGATRTPVPLGFDVVDGISKITPGTPLVAGTSYELSYDAPCYTGTTATATLYDFTVSASAPLPTKLGAIQGTPTIVTKDYGTTKYTIDATYALDPEMKPWAAVYQLLVVLDGRIVGTKATVSADGASVAVDATGWCDATNAAANPHSIGLRAQLPFATTLDSTSTAMMFGCPAPALNTPAGATPPGNGNTAPTVAPADAGASNNATAKSDSGCSATGSSSPFSFLALTAVMAAMLRRRRASVATRRT